jgi:hypothetical protein
MVSDNEIQEDESPMEEDEDDAEFSDGPLDDPDTSLDTKPASKMVSDNEIQEDESPMVDAVAAIPAVSTSNVATPFAHISNSNTLGTAYGKKPPAILKALPLRLRPLKKGEVTGKMKKKLRLDGNKEKQ